VHLNCQELQSMVGETKCAGLHRNCVTAIAITNAA
jgi:hypothetical protein